MVLLIIYTIMVGLVASGLTGSLWSLATGAPPSIDLFHDRSLRLPLIVAAVVLYAPILVLRGARDLAPRRLPAAFGLAAVACIWCFLQGVFILTQFFGAH